MENFHKIRRQCAAATRGGQEHRKIFREHLLGSRSFSKGGAHRFCAGFATKYYEKFRMQLSQDRFETRRKSQNRMRSDLAQVPEVASIARNI